jgi:hypothetical protein
LNSISAVFFSSSIIFNEAKAVKAKRTKIATALKMNIICGVFGIELIKYMKLGIITKQTINVFTAM